MSWDLTPDQRALQAEARALARDVIAPRAADVDRSEQYPWDNVDALQQAGFTGMTVPAAFGGPGRSLLDAVLVVEEMAKVCGVTGRIAVEANMGALSAVMAYGTDDQRQRVAELVLAGDKPAICITEPGAGSAASEMTTRADRRGDDYALNGTKHWITGGGVSKTHLVFARVHDSDGNEEGIGAFLAFRDETPGLIVGPREPTMGLRGLPETTIVCDKHAGRRRHGCAAAVGAETGIRRPDERLQHPAGGRWDGGPRPGLGRLRAGAGVREEARAVRPPHRRVPGSAVDAGRHVREAGGGPKPHLPGPRHRRARAAARSRTRPWPPRPRSSPPRRPSRL